MDQMVRCHLGVIIQGGMLNLNPASKVFGATYPTPGGDYQSCQKDVAPPNPSNWHDTPLYRDLFEHPRVPTSPPGRMPGTIYPWVPVGNP